MCWCIRVYWTVLQNLFIRFVNNITNAWYSGFCCTKSRKPIELKDSDDVSPNFDDYIIVIIDLGLIPIISNRQEIFDRCLGLDESGTAQKIVPYPKVNKIVFFWNLPKRALNTLTIMINDVDLEYYEIPIKKIETEPYYRTVDRKLAEEILTCREDGTCLVRPYKEQDISIKYVVSVYAKQNFFHLYIRKILGTEMYGIGQAKPFEKLFHAPSDIIDYYRLNQLLCTNKKISISLQLVPIT